jgi:hypothetical protein
VLVVDRIRLLNARSGERGLGCGGFSRTAVTCRSRAGVDHGFSVRATDAGVIDRGPGRREHRTRAAAGSRTRTAPSCAVPLASA